MNEQSVKTVISICASHLRGIIENSQRFRVISLHYSMHEFRQCYMQLQEEHPGEIPTVVIELEEKKEKLWKINQFITKLAMHFRVPIIGIHGILTHPSTIYTSFRAGILSFFPVKNISDQTWLNALENKIDSLMQLKVNRFDIPDPAYKTCSRMLIPGKRGKAILFIGGMGAIEVMNKITPELSQNFPPVIAYIQQSLPVLTELAADLDAHSNVHVGIAPQGNTVLESGNVYLIEMGNELKFANQKNQEQETEHSILTEKYAQKNSSDTIKAAAEYFGKDLVAVILGSELNDMNDGIKYLVDNQIEFIIQNKSSSRIYNNLELLKEAKITTQKRVPAKWIAHRLYDILNQMRGLRKDTVFYNVPRHETGKIYLGK